MIADVASFLVSDEARFITGETVKVDGGLLAQGIAALEHGRRLTFSPRVPASIAGPRAKPWSCRNLQPSESKKPRQCSISTEAWRLHGHLIGRQGSRRSLNTPALVLDLDMLERNIAEMANFAKASNVKLRPHSKTLNQPTS